MVGTIYPWSRILVKLVEFCTQIDNYSAPTVGLMWMFMYYHSGGHLVAKSQKNLYSLVSVQTSSDSQLKTVAFSVI